MPSSMAQANVYPLHGGRNALEAALQAWLDTLNSRRTRETYGECVRLAFRVMGRERVEQVTFDDVGVFKRLLADKKPATVALRLCALRAFFRFSLANGYTKTDPTTQVKIPRVMQGSPRALTLAEAKRIAEQIDTDDLVGKRDAATLALLFGGLRVSEVAGLSVGDVVLETQEGETFTRVSVIGKGAKPRSVDLPPRVYELVTRYLDARSGSRERGTPIFVAIAKGFRAHPDRMTADRIYRQLRRYARRAKVRITGSHVGRHTWAKLAEEGGAKLMDVMAHLGHANLNVTATYLRRLSGKRNPAHTHVPSIV